MIYSPLTVFKLIGFEIIKQKKVKMIVLCA